MSNLLNGDLIYINSINQDIIEDANTFLKKNTNLLEKKKDWACDIITTKDSHLNILNDIELQNLKSEILKHCDLYMRENNSFFDGFIDCSWFNLYKKHVDMLEKLIVSLNWETVYNDLRPLITDDDFDEYNQSKIKAKYFGIDHLEYLHEPKMLSFLKVY